MDLFKELGIKAGEPEPSQDRSVDLFEELGIEAPPEPESSLWRRVADYGVSAAKGVVDTGEALVGLTDLGLAVSSPGAMLHQAAHDAGITKSKPSIPSLGNTLEDAVGYDPETTHEALDDLYSEEQQAVNRKVRQADGFWDTTKAMVTHPSSVAHEITRSFPATMAGGAIGRTARFLGPLAGGAIGEGLIQAGGSAEEIRQKKGGLSSADRAIAVGSGIGTGAFAAAGGRLAQKLGIGDIDTMLAQGGAPTKTTKGVVKKIVGGGITEGIFEELPQSMQEQIWNNAAFDRPLLEGVGAAGATGLLTGVGMGAGANIRSGQPVNLLQGEKTFTPPQPEGGPPHSDSGEVDTGAPDVATQLADDIANGLYSTPAAAAELKTALQEDPEVAVRVIRLLEEKEKAQSGQQGPVDLLSARRSKNQSIIDETMPDEAGTLPLPLSGEANASQADQVVSKGVTPAITTDRPTQAETGSRNFALRTPEERQAEIDAIMASGEEEVTAERSVPDRRQGPRRDEEALDSLTGIPGANSIRPKVEVAKKDPNKSIFFFDIDNFKAVNDVLGHDAGDTVLTKMGEIVSSHFGDADYGRYGGEEFAVVMDNTPENAERVKEFAADVAKNLKANGEPITISGGFAPGTTIDEKGKEKLKADTLAYKAKTAGRNQVFVDKGDEKDYSISGPPVKEKDYVRHFDVQQLEATAGRLSESALASSPGVRDALARAVQAVKEAGGRDVQGQAGAAGQPAPEVTSGKEAPLSATDVAAAEADTSPTPGQIKAGNYKKGPVSYEGMNISVENPQGSTRKGTDRGGQEWENTMNHHYGYIRRTLGKDKDQIDAFIKPGTESSPKVFVVDQQDPKSGKFDEHKVMLGFDSKKEARAAYLANYEEGWAGLKNITETDLDSFKAWAFDGRKTKPFKDDVKKPTPLEEYQEYVNSLSAEDKKVAADLIETKPQRPRQAKLKIQGRIKKTKKADLPGVNIGQETAASGQGAVPTPGVQEGDVLTKAGAPFKTKGAANLAMRSKKMTDTHEAVEVGGSQWVVRKKSANQQSLKETELKQEVAPADKKNLTVESQKKPGKQEKKTTPKSTDKATSVILTDKSVRDLPQQIKISNGKITVISKVGRKKVGEYTFDVAEWENAKKGPSANPEYNFNQLINKKFRESGNLDETPEGDSMTEQIVDSQIRGIKKALNKYLVQAEATETTDKKPGPESDKKEPEILVRKAAKSDKGGSARSRIIARLQETAPEGYTAVYKPYGKDGRGYYYVFEEIDKEGIQDFGEVLHGARKHYADKLKDASELDTAKNPLSKTWPEPDYQKMIDNGEKPKVVALVRAMRDQVPSKGRTGWKVQRYVEAVEVLRSFAQEIMDGTLSYEDVVSRFEKNKALQPVLDAQDLYLAVGHDRSLKGMRIAKGSYSMYEGQEYRPPKTIWTVNKKAAASVWSNWPTTFSQGETRQEAIGNFKKNADEVFQKLDKTKGVKFSIYSKRGEDGVYIGKRYTANRYVDLEKFDTSKEARQYLAENQQALEEKLEKAKNFPSERKSENAPRVGEDHLQGQDATPDMFMEAFGFRGVQFGNYVEQSKRQEDLNETYNALMDMAGVLGIPAKSLSLNGELGLAFGARGKGGKRAPKAHFEPDTIVINLTKKSGAGSLAHEWWHALDNYFDRQRGAKGFMTEKPWARHQDTTRPEMLAAFKGVMDAIAKTDLPQRSMVQDRTRSKPYWTEKTEMSARAFESFIIEKLHDQSGANDYLANIVDQEVWDAATAMGFEQKNSYPYLTKEEIPGVKKAFQNLFDTIETKETDKGVALFQLTGKAESATDKPMSTEKGKGDITTETTPESQVEQEVAFVKSLMREGKRYGVRGERPLSSILRSNLSEDEIQYLAEDGVISDELEDAPAKSHNIGDTLEPSENFSLGAPTGTTSSGTSAFPIDRGVAIEEVLKSVDQYSNDGRIYILESDVAYIGEDIIPLRHFDLRESVMDNPVVVGIIEPNGTLIGSVYDENLEEYIQAPPAPDPTSQTQEPGTEPPFQRAPAINTAINKLAAGLKTGPTIEVVQSESDLPQPITDKIARQQAEGEINAVYYQGKTYYVADNIQSQEAAESAFLHEVFGHYGVESILGQANARRFFTNVYMSRLNTEGFRRVISDYGIDIKTKTGKILAAKEYIARQAESGVDDSLVTRLIGMIRDALRKMGLNLKINDNDIRRLIALGARQMREGGTHILVPDTTAFSKLAAKWYSEMESVLADKLPITPEMRDKALTEGMPLFMVAYHGTPHLLAPESSFPHGRFRLDRIGTGEGAQAYGWGIYFAEAKDVAKTYQGSGRAVDEAEDGYSAIEERLVGEQERAHDRGNYDRAAVIEELLINRSPSMARNHFQGDKKKQRIIDEYADLFQESNLYQLDIPDNIKNNLLDWDKPLSEQSEYVKKALVVARTDEFDLNPKDGTDIETAETAYHRISHSLGSDKAASEYLASIGIPGNKYLDQFSRDNQPRLEVRQIMNGEYAVFRYDTGDLVDSFDTKAEADKYAAENDPGKTYNYVIWDQSALDKIALLERNGEKLDAIREAEAPVFQRAPATDTHAFKKWFGDSVVTVDGKPGGEPLVVYHGSDTDIKEFSEKMLGATTGAGSASKGFFFTNDEGVAKTYADHGFFAKASENYDSVSLLSEANTVRYEAEQDAEFTAKTIAREVIARISPVKKGRKTSDTVATQIHKAYPQQVDSFGGVDVLADEIQRLSKVDALPEQRDLRSEYFNRVFDKKGLASTLKDITDRGVKEYFLKIENPHVHDFRGERYREEKYTDIIDRAISEGSDGVILKNTFDAWGGNANQSPHDVYIAFSPTQIKSIHNRGTFDESDPDILFQRVKKPETVHDATNPYDPEAAKAGREAVDKIMARLQKAKPKEPKVTVSESQARKLAGDYLKYREKSRSAALDTEAKIKEFKGFLMGLPPAVRAKAMAGMPKLTMARTPETRQKYFEQAQEQAQKYLSRYFKMMLRHDIHRLRKKPKSPKPGDVKKSKLGPEGQETLEIINNEIFGSNLLKTNPQAMNALAAINSQRQQLKEEQPDVTEVRELKRWQNEVGLLDKKAHLIQVFGGINDMTVDELQNAYDELKHILQTGRTRWMIMEMARKAETEKLKVVVSRDITGQEDPAPETAAEKQNRLIKERGSTIHSISSKLSSFDTVHQSWRFLMDKLSRYGKGGTLQTETVKLIGGLVHHATSKENMLNIEATDMISNKLTELVGKKKRSLRRWIDEQSETRSSYTLTKPGGIQETISLAPMEAAYWWAVHRRGQGLAREGNTAFFARLEKMGVNKDFIQQVESKVDPKIVELATWLSDAIGEHVWQTVNPVHEARMGAKLTHSQNYTPVVADYHRGPSDDNLLQQWEKSPGMMKGALHELTKTQIGVKPKNLLEVWVDHIHDMNHFAAWALPVQTVEDIFGSAEIRNFVERDHGAGMVRAIDEFIDHFKTGQKRRKEMFSTLDRLRGKFSTAVLGVNPVVYMKQMTSIPAMAADMPTGAFTAGVADFFKAPVRNVRTLNESVFIQNRFGRGHTRDVAVATAKSVGQAVAKTESLQSQLMLLTRMGDMQAIYVGGWAVYRYHKDRYIKQGMSEKEAHQEALLRFEEAARDTQQSGEIMDLGLIQQAGPFPKLMTMFMTAPASYYREVSAAVRALKKTPKDALRRLTLFWVVVPAVFESISSAPLLAGDDEDDIELFFKRLLRGMVLGPVNGLFIARDIASYLYNQAFLKEEAWMKPGYAPVTAPVEKAGSLVREASKDVEEMDFGGMIEDMIDISGYLTGYPLPAGQNLVRGWAAVAEGDTKHPVARSIGYGKYAVNE